MITTGCDGCCFLKRDNNDIACMLNQVCMIHDNQVVTPGYCRFCRTHKWAKQQNTANIRGLYQKVLTERELKFDLLVIFDEAVHTLQHLETTLNGDWYKLYINRVIIVDVTGFSDNRKNIALQYLKNKRSEIEIKIDSSVSQEPLSEVESTISRISAQVSAPFFMVIPAGKRVSNINMLASNVKSVPSRVIHWSFPTTVFGTLIIPYRDRLWHGLFITKPYRALLKNHEEKTFTEQIALEEKEMNMRLSWLCEHCWMI